MADSHEHLSAVLGDGKDPICMRIATIPNNQISRHDVGPFKVLPTVYIGEFNPIDAPFYGIVGRVQAPVSTRASRLGNRRRINQPDFQGHIEFKWL